MNRRFLRWGARLIIQLRQRKTDLSWMRVFWKDWIRMWISFFSVPLRIHPEERYGKNCFLRLPQDVRRRRYALCWMNVSSSSCLTRKRCPCSGRRKGFLPCLYCGRSQRSMVCPGCGSATGSLQIFSSLRAWRACVSRGAYRFRPRRRASQRWMRMRGQIR